MEIWTACTCWANSVINKQLLVTLEAKFHFSQFLVAFHILIHFDLMGFLCFPPCKSWNILLKLNGNQLTNSVLTLKHMKLCKPNYIIQKKLRGWLKTIPALETFQAYENLEINKGQNRHAHFAHFIKSKEQAKCVVRRNRAG